MDEESEVEYDPGELSEVMDDEGGYEDTGSDIAADGDGYEEGPPAQTENSPVDEATQLQRRVRHIVPETSRPQMYEGDVNVENEISDTVPAAQDNSDVQFHNDECSICDRTDNEDNMLLCDHCHRAYHTSCITPALTSIPDGEWRCPACKMVDAFKTAQREKKDVYVSYPTPSEKKGQAPHTYLETYNLYKVTRIDEKNIGKHRYYTAIGHPSNKAGTGPNNTRANPAGGHEYYQSRNAVREFEQVIAKDVAYLDGPFVDPAKRAPFQFSDTDTRLCIALTNAEQERLESSRAKRLPVIGPVEKAQQRATKRQRTGYVRIPRVCLAQLS